MAPRSSLEETLADDDVRTSTPGFVQGDAIGRYVVLRRLDEGGMGVVYVAYDPKLDRRLAVKVLHPSRRSARSRSMGRARLLREAQALARLSHPNVVAVHDVGTHGDAVFIAMELVDGQTLDDWAKAEGRTWRDVLGVLLEAGRGLQAAHDADLVHRDLKPDNVMVDTAGHARVLDFGLARAREGQQLPPSSEDDVVGALGSMSVSSPITVAGALVGTPAYMAPEQFAGMDCDARSDQFSFCVCAWRMLYGQRPFEGTSAPALSAAVLEGELVDPPTDRGIPAHVRRALVRGLSTRREDRFASMAELLADLQRDPMAKVRRWSLFGGMGLSAAAITALMMGEPAACTDGQTRIEEVWNESARAEIASQFASVPAFGDAAWSRVGASLDAYADGWQASYREACEATHVRKTQSEHALDLRMSCLDERRRSLGAFVTVLRSADPEMVEASADGLGSLQPLEVCNDLERLQARVQPPDNAEDAARVEEIRETLARVVAQWSAGKSEAAREAVRPLLERAAEIGYEPLTAEVELQAGRLEADLGGADEAVALLRTAYFRARAAGHDELTRFAAISLVHAVGSKQQQLEPALEWAAHARAELTRNPSTAAEAKLELGLATAQRLAGKYAAAVPHAERALQLCPDADAARARALLGLAAALAEAGRREEARALHAEIMQLHETVYGPVHPSTGQAAHNLASALAVWDEAEAARPFALRAVEIWRRSRPESRSLAMGLTTLGLIQIRAKEVDAGLATLDEARVIVEKLRGPRDSEVGKIHGNIGLALHDKGDDKGALDRFTLARDIFVDAHGPEHPLVGMAESNMGMAHEGLDDPASAITHYARAVELLDPAFGEDDRRLLSTIEALQRLETRVGHDDLASRWQSRLDRIHAKNEE